MLIESMNFSQMIEKFFTTFTTNESPMIAFIVAMPVLAWAVHQSMKNEIAKNPEGKVATMNEDEFDAEYKSRLIKFGIPLVISAYLILCLI